MNYRHAYHAGNFADVVKHVILTGLLVSLSRKETGFCYIDTHAGIGYYDLFSDISKKTKEFESGIKKVIRYPNPPPLVKYYLDCVHQINNELTHSHYASLRYYPGSPKLAHYLIRPQDRIILCELHPEDYQFLHQTFSGERQVAVHHLDGFLGLKAFLPPRERRGLVLIDPSYEGSLSPLRKDSVDDFIRIIDSLSVGLKRWDKGIYMIWYPIKDKSLVTRFFSVLREKVTQPIFKIELTCYPDIPNHLNGSGVAIINPPWQFDQTMNQTLPWLWKALTINNQGGYVTSFLK